MSHFTRSLVLLPVILLLSLSILPRGYARIAEPQGGIFSDVPQKIDVGALYLFYLHGRIVEQGRRPTNPQYGVYEYDEILNALKHPGFVVISEQRKVGTEIEPYGAKVARQVRQLLDAGVPPQHITVVGASQGSWIAMLASTYLKNRRLNFVFIAGCSADEGFLRLIDLHGNVLSIYEQSDGARSCEAYRKDATGIADYKEVALNTGLRHGFIYRPMKEWVEPTIAWAQAKSK
jgi:pimeloyl-ACP methyl ester carboxylesterase